MSQAVSLDDDDDDDDVCRTFDLRVGAGTGFWGVSGCIGTAGLGLLLYIMIACTVGGTHWVSCICYIRVCLGLLGCVTLLADT